MEVGTLEQAVTSAHVGAGSRSRHTNYEAICHTQIHQCICVGIHTCVQGFTSILRDVVGPESTPGTSISALHNCHVLVVRQLYFLLADTKFIVLRGIPNDLA